MTIYDIAKEAGVSASTVSRVINDKPGISAHTRQKVQDLLDKYHFEVNASARGLIAQASGLIGIMMSDIRTAHHAESAYFIEQQLRTLGYSCMIVNSGFTDASREDGFRLLSSRKIEALVLIGSTFATKQTAHMIQALLPTDTPVVLENGYLDLPNVYSILSDEENGIAACTDLLIKKGRQHLAYLNLHDTPSNRLKKEGFLRYHRPDRDLIYEMSPQAAEEDWDCSYRQTQTLLAHHPEIDAMIYATDQLANAGIYALQDLGIDVPDQVAVIGVDDSAYAKLSRPRLTVLDNKMQELSMTCADTLVKLLHHKPVPKRVMILSEIVEREST